MDDLEWGAAGAMLYRYPFGPEDGGEDRGPLLRVVLDRLHDSFADVAVSAFDDAVCA